MIALAIEALIGSALLMGLVLAVRTPVRRAFGAHVAYALWLLPVLRMLLPPLPEGWRGDALPVLPTPEPITVYLGAPVATLPAEATAAGPGWPAMLLVLWLAGAAGLMLWHVVDYWRFRHRVLRNGIAVDRVGAVTVVQSVAVSGPLAFGVLDKVVAFPRDFAARFDAGERQLALEHELGHHARGDLAANWVALAMLAVHWFNPLAWMAFRAFRADQEMANDAGVLARAGSDARHAYGCAIVKAAHGRTVTAACHLHTIKDLKGRLRMLGRKRVSRGRLAAGVVLTTGLALGALGLTASGTQAAERVRSTMEDATGIDMAGLDQTPPPAPPRAPTPPAAPQPPAPPAAPDVPAGVKKRVTVVQDGRSATYDDEAADAYLAAHPMPAPPVPPMPPVPGFAPPVPPVPPTPPVVSERRCGTGGGSASQMVINRHRGDRHVMIICTDRIERAASRAAEGAKRAAEAAMHGREMQRQALRTALASLEHARAGLADNRHLSAADRSEALAGMDRAIDEMRAEAAHDD